MLRAALNEIERRPNSIIAGVLETHEPLTCNYTSDLEATHNNYMILMQVGIDAFVALPLLVLPKPRKSAA